MENIVVHTLLWVIGGLLGVLVLLIAWIGVRIHDRLDSISKSLSDIKDELQEDIELHGRKLAVLYSRCRNNHGPME